jgi:hypothetical protein
MKRWFLPVLLPLLALVAMGTSRPAPPPQGAPALPPGFAQNPVPDTPLAAYLYLAQEGPTRLSPAALDIRGDIGVVSAALWVAPDGTTVGGSALLRAPGEAGELASLLEREIEPTPEVYRQGSRVTMVWRADGPSPHPLREAVRANRMVPFPEHHPRAWRLMERLPSTPPGAPVGAGFFTPNRDLLRTLTQGVGTDLSGLGQVMGTARIDAVSFGLYLRRPFALDAPVEEDVLSLLKRHEASVVAVAQAGLPGFIVRLGMGIVARQAGLQATRVQGHTVYALSLGDVHLRLYHQGNTFFLALAPSPSLAQDAIVTILPPGRR